MAVQAPASFPSPHYSSRIPALPIAAALPATPTRAPSRRDWGHDKAPAQPDTPPPAKVSRRPFSSPSIPKQAFINGNDTEGLILLKH